MEENRLNWVVPQSHLNVQDFSGEYVVKSNSGNRTVIGVSFSHTNIPVNLNMVQCISKLTQKVDERVRYLEAHGVKFSFENRTVIWLFKELPDRNSTYENILRLFNQT